MLESTAIILGFITIGALMWRDAQRGNFIH